MRLGGRGEDLKNGGLGNEDLGSGVGEDLENER